MAFKNENAAIEQLQTISVPEATYLATNWCRKEQRRNEGLTRQVCIKLKEMYDSGSLNKSVKISADTALAKLLETSLANDYYNQILVTVPKIKQFFSKSSIDQQKMIDSLADGDELD